MTFRKKTTRLFTRSFAPFVVSSASSSSPASCATCSPFDQTRGGYEPPYTGYTATPIDWTTLDVTADGMGHRGHVVNVLIDCTAA